MRTYIVSVVPENDDLTAIKNESLATVVLDKEHGVIIYRDSTSGKILVPAGTALSFQQLKALVEHTGF